MFEFPPRITSNSRLAYADGPFPSIFHAARICMELQQSFTTVKAHQCSPSPAAENQVQLQVAPLEVRGTLWPSTALQRRTRRILRSLGHIGAYSNDVILFSILTLRGDVPYAEFSPERSL